jgi:transposase
VKSRKKYNSKFKGEVALAAIKGEETLASLSQKYELHPTQITKWKNDALKSFSNLFEQEKQKDTGNAAEVGYLERKVGQLTIEIDYLKKKCFSYPGMRETK